MHGYFCGMGLCKFAMPIGKLAHQLLTEHLIITVELTVI